uniref:Lactate/malate dehydrogenase N-terminal domain-containing protein n=1 Tax=Oryza brachyantha TaxID=4533 RepID=J3MD35_ORYBR
MAIAQTILTQDLADEIILIDAVADKLKQADGDGALPRRRLIKISLIGAGNVGMAIAQTILTQDLADEIVLIDAVADKVRGEMLDLQHAAAFLPRVNNHVPH